MYRSRSPPPCILFSRDHGISRLLELDPCCDDDSSKLRNRPILLSCPELNTPVKRGMDIPVEDYPMSRLIGSRNGFIGLMTNIYDINTSVYISNALLGEYFKLKLPQLEKSDCSVTYRFYFSEVSGKHKLVRSMTRRFRDNHEVSELDIYTLGFDEKWINLGQVPYPVWYDFCQVSVNGALHWMDPVNKDSIYSSILRLKSSSFCQIVGFHFHYSRIIQKILVTVPERFESTITTLENTKDLSKITLAELLSAFQAQEQRRVMRQEGAVEGALPAKHHDDGHSMKKKKNKYQTTDKEGAVHNNKNKIGGFKGNYPPCKHCGKLGHTPFKCWKRSDAKCTKCNQLGHEAIIYKKKNQQQDAEDRVIDEQEEDQLFVASYFTSSVSSELWLIDSGCTYYMTCDKDNFKDLRPTKVTKFIIVHGGYIPAKGMGTITIETQSGTKTISDVLYVPDFDQNLLTGGQLLEKGFKLYFKDNHCLIKEASGQDPFKIKMRGRSFSVNPLEEERRFHQLCVDSPLLKKDIRPEDEGWLCLGYDCKFDCIDLLNNLQGIDFSATDSWEKVYSKETIVASEEKLHDISGLPSDGSEDDDYNTENPDVEKNNFEAEASYDESNFFSISEDLAEAPPKDDGILGLSSEDSEDDDFNLDDLDKDELVKTKCLSYNFISDSEDFSLIVDTNRLRGDEQGVFSSVDKIMPNSASQEEKAKVGKDVVTVIRTDEAHHRDVNHFASPFNKIEIQNGKRPLEDDQEVKNVQCRLQKQSDDSNLVEVDLSLGVLQHPLMSMLTVRSMMSKLTIRIMLGIILIGARLFLPSTVTAPSLFSFIALGLHFSRSHYGAIASLNRNFF
ncbi:putative beta-(1,2)-xylosyltransferase-like [Capsicum annuum]|nr:putative beta-(1,2)-xylosyltransferase-like [Capsicum annuum]